MPLRSRPLTDADDARPLRVLLRRPMLVALAALTTVALTTLALAVAVVSVLGPRVDRANEMLAAVQDGHIAMLDQETGLRGFLVTREVRFLQPYWRGVSDLRRTDAALDRIAGEDPGLAVHVRELQEAQQRFITGWVEPVLTTQPAIGDTVALGELLSREKALFDHYRTVEGHIRELMEERREQVGVQRSAIVLGGAVLGLVVALAVALAVRRAGRRLAGQLLPPTQRVRETLASLASGDLDSRATETGPAELRDIAGDVNALGVALRERSDLVAARERELMGARDEAERAGQAKTAFLATMSHEIRTPLNAVLGLTDLLLTTSLTDEQRGHLETVSHSGDSLLALINDILDFSKIEAGELDLEQAPFDIAGLVYDVAQLLAPQAAGKGLDLLVDIPGDGSWRAVGDGARLRQVLTNLVGNAVKFTTAGQVVVSLAGEESGGVLACRLAVSDTGIGIPAGQRHRLFRSFSQGDASITRSYGGTGLGLAISQRIARAMGGDITVDSREGGGSTFTVAVRLAVAPAAPEDDPGGSLAGRRLLVVDDNATNLRILEHQLGRTGATCVLVDSGAAALAALEDGSFDACLLDLHMPGMGGEELAARLRAHPVAGAMPLVLLSSAAHIPCDGAVTFDARLHKPVRPERLAQTLQAVLQRAAGSRADGSSGAVPALSRPAGQRLRVLVAEDHAVNAHLIGLYLRQLGHDSVHVENGALAVEAVRRDSYDVVLMDAQMPVMGGVAATTAIRALDVPQPVVVAVTASVLASDRTAFHAAGADEFLTKPVRMATLGDALERVAAGRPGGIAVAAQVAPAGDVPGDVPGDVLDRETVEELRDLGEDGFAHLYRRYADGLTETVAALLAADITTADPHDENGTPRLAHRLKGSSAAMGALRLAEICRQLEEADAASPGRDDALTALRDESRRVHEAVAALLGGEQARAAGPGGPAPTIRA
ncbi:hybrid sensor histidine kinase/response regulator [Blastococcus sp. VKM Ac-2987]|uniref:hybrid sensor histidine kinase/response regulator n=1 Tax=Blastococcus sp. VKM Ac-2987 TaxID=3004141 RepID=UPI0022AB63E9|nr:response regulator [Blastococcus sp. VKM Ac-2987]MCZ2858567.1 response regulator [Blastococcus sp. VKM Ac-2987]